MRGLAAKTILLVVLVLYVITVFVLLKTDCVSRTSRLLETRARSNLALDASWVEKDISDLNLQFPHEFNITERNNIKGDVIAEHTVDYSNIMMTTTETDTLLKYLFKIDTYIEWGSGGSTLNFAPFARRVAHSIEHDPDWCEKVKSKLSKSRHYARIVYHCVLVSKGYRNWGRSSSFEEGTYFQFDKYVDRIDALGEPLFDFVLIDGRARVATAIKSLAYISPDSRVVLHDATRIFKSSVHHPRYDLITTYYDFEEFIAVQGRAGIAIMTRKPQWQFLQGNVSAVNDLLQKLKR